MNLQNEPGPAPRMEPAPNILLPNNSTNIQQNKALTSKISIFYAPVDQPWKLYKHVDLEWIYKILRSTKYKLITEKLRLIDPNDKDARKAYKQAHFDYATFAGTFSYHADKDLINRSCYFDVDLDHIGNMAALEAMKSRILSQYTPALLFISPSGDGLQLVYQIDPNQGTHLQFFEALTNYHKKEFGVEIDQKCKNPSRACFLPYDPKCIKPDNPTLLGSDFLTVYPPDKPLKSTTTEQRDNSDNDAEGEIIENQEEIIKD